MQLVDDVVITGDTFTAAGRRYRVVQGVPGKRSRVLLAQGGNLFVSVIQDIAARTGRLLGTNSYVNLSELRLVELVPPAEVLSLFPPKGTHGQDS